MQSAHCSSDHLLNGSKILKNNQSLRIQLFVLITLSCRRRPSFEEILKLVKICHQRYALIPRKMKNNKEMQQAMDFSKYNITPLSVLFTSLQVGNLVIYSDPSVLLLLLASFSVSTIMLCFLISVFFSKANLSAACGAVFFFLTYVPFTMVVAWDQVMGIRSKVAVVSLAMFGNVFQYGIKNKAAITLQCKPNDKLNSCLALYCVYSSYLRR